MNGTHGTDLLIAVLLFGVVSLFAGLAVWAIEASARKREADWTTENRGAQRW